MTGMDEKVIVVYQLMMILQSWVGGGTARSLGFEVQHFWLEIVWQNFGSILGI